MLKKLLSVLLTGLIAFMPVMALADVSAPVNLIANPSMENIEEGQPTNWIYNEWGAAVDVAAPSITNDAQDGAKSLRVDISGEISAGTGDAKWHFTPVAVTPGKTYTYRTHYKSNVTTHFAVNYWSTYVPDTDAELMEFPLADASASPDTWKLYEGEFTVPAGKHYVTIFHFIDKAGYLVTDNVSLTEKAPAPITESLAIQNASVEEGYGAEPTGWMPSIWGMVGNNYDQSCMTTDFERPNEGHTGNKSIKVTVSDYACTNGDAKWYPTPITTLLPGHQYRFNVYYKTNTIPKVVAEYAISEGGQTRYLYFGMPAPQPGIDGSNPQTDWQLYSDTFTVPQNTTAVSIFMFLDHNGWVQTDDYSLEHYTPEGFARPLLTLTFDDGHEDNVTNLLPLLNQPEYSSIKTTQCYMTGASVLEPGSPPVLEGNEAAWDGIVAFYRAGHEICSHTVTHPMLTKVNPYVDETDPSGVRYELKHSKEVLEDIVFQKTGERIEVVNFASPHGDYNMVVNNIIKDYYHSHRTVDEGFNSKDNYDIYRLRVQNILNTTTAEQVAAWIEQARATNTWLILVYHRIADDAEQFDTYPEVFRQHLEVIVESGITVKTLQEALVETRSQVPATLMLERRVINDNGGAATANDFPFTLNGQPVNFGPGVADGPNTIKYTTTLVIDPFVEYTLAELHLDGYEPAYGWHCVNSLGKPIGRGGPIGDEEGIFAAIRANAREHITCTITNNDIEQPSEEPEEPEEPILKDGDTNGDNVVNLSDLRILSKHYGKEAGATRSEGDLNGDGAVNLSDLRILSKNWSNE